MQLRDRREGYRFSADLDSGHEWLRGQSRSKLPSRRGLSLKVALGFAAFGMVCALVVAPAADDAVHRTLVALNGGDDLTTASIRRNGKTRRYTVRRSVLQPAGAKCVIYSDGTTAGDC